MQGEPLKVAIIAGESSGDLLGADLVAALRHRHGGEIQLVGVGGPALEAQGLQSLFDFSTLSIMGFSAVIARLPKLIALISQTAKAIIDARPDVLVIIDSPDFTHRVAKRVRKALPGLAVVNYVSPSVWAWKAYRARDMLAYVDHVLAVLPFEPEAMQRLGGPPTTYVGHRLRLLPELLETRAQLLARQVPSDGPATILLLPGSRTAEIRRLLPIYGKMVEFLAGRGTYRFLLPTVAHKEDLVRSIIANWAIKPEVHVGEQAKWRAFAQADAAVAASGTVLLELALTGIPVVSTYKTDFIVRMILDRIRIWSAALPNLIADYPVVPEYFDGFVRHDAIGRALEQLARQTPARSAMLAGFDRVFDRMDVPSPPADMAAEILLNVIATKKPGHN